MHNNEKIHEFSTKKTNQSCSCFLIIFAVSRHSYLHPGLGQVGAHGQPLPHHHIWIVGLLEGLLQRLQLLRGEGRAAAALLAVLGAVASLQDDVLECAAVGKEANTRAKFIPPPFFCASLRVRVCVCSQLPASLSARVSACTEGR